MRELTDAQLLSLVHAWPAPRFEFRISPPSGEPLKANSDSMSAQNVPPNQNKRKVGSRTCDGGWCWPSWLRRDHWTDYATLRPAVQRACGAPAWRVLALPVHVAVLCHTASNRHYAPVAAGRTCNHRSPCPRPAAFHSPQLCRNAQSSQPDTSDAGPGIWCLAQGLNC